MGKQQETEKRTYTGVGYSLARLMHRSTDVVARFSSGSSGVLSINVLVVFIARYCHCAFTTYLFVGGGIND
jgi:hypothetical protein